MLCWFVWCYVTAWQLWWTVFTNSQWTMDDLVHCHWLIVHVGLGGDLFCMIFWQHASYRPPTKLQEGNVFSRVYQSVCSGGVHMPCAPFTGPLGMLKLVFCDVWSGGVYLTQIPSCCQFIHPLQWKYIAVSQKIWTFEKNGKAWKDQVKCEAVHACDLGSKYDDVTS